ncbi:MAG: hypothetical protein M1814_006532 [Vezdaea aestivalis]|nr:MAG: hypothetical protein M1814_006532 [Vezdaea aestivalis]
MFSVRRYPVFLFVAACLILFFYYKPGPVPDVESIDEQTATEGTSRTKYKKLPEHYPVKSFHQLPTGDSKPIPRIQFDFPSNTQSSEQKERQKAVRDSFKHAWHGYKEHAWLKDELTPLSGSFSNPFGGWAATLIDSLDSLWMLDLKADFEEAVKAIDAVDFTSTDLPWINVFETTIRYLGGLLGAFDISGAQYPLLLKKAEEIGEVLYSAFDTPNRMPVTRWSWGHYLTNGKQQALSSSLVAEVGSLSIEFTRLSQLTGNPKYFDAVQRISDAFEKTQTKTMLPGLWPVVMNAEAVNFDGGNGFTLGGMADSVYEYLPKQYMMLGGHSDQSKKMYESAIEAANEHLFFRPMTKDGPNVLLSGDAQVGHFTGVELSNSSQHLTCFAGAMVGVGAKIFEREADLEIARRLVDGCIWAYENTETGIMPEIFSAVPCQSRKECPWNEALWHENLLPPIGPEAELSVEERIAARRLSPGFTDIRDRRYLLRPEAIESVFTLYRITGDKKLQDKAWTMFQQIEKWCHTDIGHAAITDVTSTNPAFMDKMESFWLAETLKYFYLIFSPPDLVSLDDYVLNTEAHPFRRPR